jgi:hypothetical protein
MLEARGAENQSFIVRAQQVATLTGTTRLAFTTATLGAPDSFDTWALERDRRDDVVLSTEAAQSMPAEDIVGYEDLDKYGTWRSEPDYGYVRTPSSVTADWAPYRFGSYTYVSGWGWAWIDNSPWGFAPYHYGRWVTIGSRWCWVPGPRHGRPVSRAVGVAVGSSLAGQRPPPRRGWHVPRPPRSYTVQSGVPAADVTRIGTRAGFLSTDDLARREAWRSQRNSGSSFRTVPDPTPSTALPPDRRVTTPRYEPRNPRADSRAGSYVPPVRGTWSPPQRPASPPSQQQRPVVSQPRPAVTPPPTISRPAVSPPPAIPRPAVSPPPRPAPSAGAAPRGDRSNGVRPPGSGAR